MNYDEHLVEFTKIGENANLVKLASDYDNNCSAEKVVIVSDAVLEYMLQSDRDMNALARRERDHTISGCYDDGKGGALTMSVLSS